MARVLLTGARGFIGRAILERLIAGGHEVVTLGRAEAPAGAADHIALDLPAAQRSAIAEAVRSARASHAVHAAWYTDPRDYLVNPVNRDWLRASTDLLECFTEGEPDRRFVGLGTCFEYSVGGGRLSESAPVGPQTLYGECKLALSQAVEQTPGAAWARVFFVYGPGDRPARLVPALISKALAGEPLPVRFGGLRRDYIHTHDLARQITEIAFSAVTGTINTGTGAAMKLGEMARQTALAAGQPQLADTNSDVPPDQPELIESDTRRLTSEVAPIEYRSFAEGVAELIAAERSQ